MTEIALEAIRPWVITGLAGFWFGIEFRAAWAFWPLKIKVAP